MKLSYKRTTLNVPIATLRFLQRHMRYVRAAGGLVFSPDGRALYIRRNGRFDLPKGKVEQGETLAQAAVREVETGVKANIVLRQGTMLPLFCHKTYHLYHLYGGWHLKQTTWYAMTAEQATEVVPQTEEGIEGGQWMKPDELCCGLDHSYGTMRTLSALLREKHPWTSFPR